MKPNSSQEKGQAVQERGVTRLDGGIEFAMGKFLGVLC